MSTDKDRRMLVAISRELDGYFDKIKDARMDGKIPGDQADKMLLRLEMSRDKADRLLASNRPLSRTFNSHCVMLMVAADNLKIKRFD